MTNDSSGGPLINLKNNYLDNKKINLGTILRKPIEKFYEQPNNCNNIKINKDANENMEQKLNINNNKNTKEIINNKNKDLNEIDEITMQYKVENSDKIG